MGWISFSFLLYLLHQVKGWGLTNLSQGLQLCQQPQPAHWLCQEGKTPALLLGPGKHQILTLQSWLVSECGGPVAAADCCHRTTGPLRGLSTVHFLDPVTPRTIKTGLGGRLCKQWPSQHTAECSPQQSAFAVCPAEHLRYVPGRAAPKQRGLGLSFLCVCRRTLECSKPGNTQQCLSTSLTHKESKWVSGLKSHGASSTHCALAWEVIPVPEV